MNKIFIAFAVFSTITLTATIQGQEIWVARYNGLGDSTDYASAITVDNSGNVYVTGASDGLGTSRDYTTIKYNSAGDTMWVRRYNGACNWATAIAVDKNGNVCVTGASWGSGSSQDYTTIKYDSLGDTVWVKRYNGTGNSSDNAYAMAIDGNGNVYVTGTSWGSGTYSDYATIKYNSAGDTVWCRRYNGTGNDWDVAYAITVDEKDNVYVTGASWGSGSNQDYATIKYDSSGDSVWVRRYNGTGNYADGASGIAVDGLGNVYVTGESDASGSGTDDDYATIKYNSSGDTVWVRRYNGTGHSYDIATAIAIDKDGNVYVTGRSYGSGTGFDYATIKYDSSGDSMWVRRYDGTGNGSDNATAMAMDSNGNVYVTGGSYGSGLTHKDYVTIEYNSAGDSIWAARYNGTSSYDDAATAIAVDGNGNVYVTGESYGIGTYEDYTTIKYSCIGVEETKFQSPTPNPRLEMFPNPLTNFTKIRCELTEDAYVKIELYNLAGRKIATVAEGKQSAGEQVYCFKGNEISGSGIYFIKFSVGEYKEIKKVVLMK